MEVRAGREAGRPNFGNLLALLDLLIEWRQPVRQVTIRCVHTSAMVENQHPTAQADLFAEGDPSPGRGLDRCARASLEVGPVVVALEPFSRR